MIKKIAIILIVLASFALPILAWSQMQANLTQESTVIQQPPGKFTIILIRPIGFYISGKPVSLSYIEATNIMVTGGSFVYASPTRPDLGKEIIIPAYNIVSIIRNE